MTVSFHVLSNSLRSNRPFFFPMAQQPPVGQGFLIIEASRSHSDSPHSVGLLYTSDQTVVGNSTWRHTTLTTDRHPCVRRDSNPQSQQANGRWDRQSSGLPPRILTHCSLKHSGCYIQHVRCHNVRVFCPQNALDLFERLIKIRSRVALFLWVWKLKF
jgi:hypothetical protein